MNNHRIQSKIWAWKEIERLCMERGTKKRHDENESENKDIEL